MSALFDRTGILRASDFGPDDDDEGREYECTLCDGAGWRHGTSCPACLGRGVERDLPAAARLCWNDGGASECVDQMEIPF